MFCLHQLRYNKHIPINKLAPKIVLPLGNINRDNTNQGYDENSKGILGILLSTLQDHNLFEKIINHQDIVDPDNDDKVVSVDNEDGEEDPTDLN